MGKIFDLTRLIVLHHIGAGLIFKLLFYTIPYFLSYIIPISALLSTLLTFLRLNHDREFIALKTAGITPKIFFSPLMPFAFGVLFLTLFVTSLGIPWGSSAARDLIFKITQKKAEVALKPGIFNDRIPGLIIYVGKIENGVLKDVFIYQEDKKNKGWWHKGQVIIAKSGCLAKDRHRLVIHLKKGCIVSLQEDKEAHFLNYNQYNLVINLPKSFGQRHKNPKEYSPWRLWQMIKRHPKNATPYILAFHRKLVLPISALIFVYLGAALGLKESQEKRMGGITLGLLCFIIYQILFSAANSLGETHVLPTHLSLWIPNIMAGLFTIYLWHGVIHD